MTIRFWPGICWKTWEVQSDACGPVSIGVRKIARSPPGVRA
jgi:hypothetical protein